MGECSICGIKGETRHIPLYVNGSEGITPCLSCELSIVNFISGMQSAAGRSRLALAKYYKDKENKVNKMKGD